MDNENKINKSTSNVISIIILLGIFTTYIKLFKLKSILKRRRKYG